MKSPTPEVVEELHRLQKEGVLLAEDVVKAARKKTSALHNYFEWDDTKAAHEFRLVQARNLIKAVVTIIPQTNEPVQVFVSLREDRQKSKGGYRRVDDVLNDKDRRKALIKEALKDLEYSRMKYEQLTELQEIWRAIRRARKRFEL